MRHLRLPGVLDVCGRILVIEGWRLLFPVREHWLASAIQGLRGCRVVAMHFRIVFHSVPHQTNTFFFMRRMQRNHRQPQQLYGHRLGGCIVQSASSLSCIGSFRYSRCYYLLHADMGFNRTGPVATVCVPCQAERSAVFFTGFPASMLVAVTTHPRSVA